MDRSRCLKSGGLIAAVLLVAIALLSCTGAQAPSAPTAAAVESSVAVAPKRFASIPGLTVVAPAEGDSVEPGAKVKPGYKVLMTGVSIVTVEETPTVDALAPDGTDFLLTFDAAGTDAFALITQEYTGRQIAFVVDGTVVQAPQIMSVIRDGVVVLTLPAREATLLRSAMKVH